MRKAVDAGVKIAISTDAHAADQLEWQPYGTDRAAECGVTAEQVVNAWSADDLLGVVRRRTRPERAIRDQSERVSRARRSRLPTVRGASAAVDAFVVAGADRRDPDRAGADVGDLDRVVGQIARDDRALAAPPDPHVVVRRGQRAVRAVAQLGHRVAQTDEVARQREHRVGIVSLVGDVVRGEVAVREPRLDAGLGEAGARLAASTASACARRRGPCARRGTRRPDRACDRAGRRCRACRSRRRSRGTACRAGPAA